MENKSGEILIETIARSTKTQLKWYSCAQFDHML